MDSIHREATKMDPDIIVFTGDFLDTNRDNVVGQIETLNCFKATYKLAVSGNHDFYSNYEDYMIFSKDCWILNDIS